MYRLRAALVAFVMLAAAMFGTLSVTTADADAQGCCWDGGCFISSIQSYINGYPTWVCYYW